MGELTYAQRQVVQALVEIATTGRTYIRYNTFISYVMQEPRGGQEVSAYLKDMLRRIQIGQIRGLTTGLEREMTAQVESILEKYGQPSLDPEAKSRLLTEFNLLGRQMTRTEDRAERLRLSRHRSELAGQLQIKGTYENHCWRCQGDISSVINARCPVCRLFMCNECGACMCRRY